jgi:hypothetical protein
MKRFFIGDIAKKFGLNPRTIRYYEAIGANVFGGGEKWNQFGNWTGMTIFIYN